MGATNGRAFPSRKNCVLADEGFSLPELIVAMFLFGIVMTLVVTLFATFNSHFTRERSATDSTNVASIGMNETSKVIRAGTIINRDSGSDLPIFVVAGNESVRLYSYLAADSLNPAPIMVELKIDGNRQLVETRWDATRDGTDQWIFPAATPENSTSSRVVARKLLPPTGSSLPLFTYLRPDGTVIPAPVASTDLGNIGGVKVTMTVQADETERAAPVELHNRVGLPNLTSSRLGLEG
ncbi:MAG: type secretion system protein [Microbacteriaceae bacterium]|jgi:prepilin-type N-terminal cleavage/methylation domain-containing protein|nr:type secretion system protein [Microbacteriaceae bacterium]HEV7957600.1 prepilin-type N-terminal cleavage/methylation domain-containing protein [Marisediminicola sp.]